MGDCDFPIEVCCQWNNVMLISEINGTYLLAMETQSFSAILFHYLVFNTFCRKYTCNIYGSHMDWKMGEKNSSQGILNRKVWGNFSYFYFHFSHIFNWGLYLLNRIFVFVHYIKPSTINILNYSCKWVPWRNGVLKGS